MALKSIPAGTLRPEKILVALRAISGGSTRPCKYEDIVVKAFEMFPADFQLRGYPQYPDSSDIHKPLYGPLKRRGLVRAANKTFSLTEKGVEAANHLAQSFGISSGAGVASGRRLSRAMETEISRLKRTEAWKLFCESKADEILDTDFYSYLGVAVRTDRNSFIGRLKAVSEAVEAAAAIDASPQSAALLELHNRLRSKFESLIQRHAGGG